MGPRVFELFRQFWTPSPGRAALLSARGTVLDEGWDGVEPSRRCCVQEKWWEPQAVSISQSLEMARACVYLPCR